MRLRLAVLAVCVGMAISSYAKPRVVSSAPVVMNPLVNSSVCGPSTPEPAITKAAVKIPSVISRVIPALSAYEGR